MQHCGLECRPRYVYSQDRWGPLFTRSADDTSSGGSNSYYLIALWLLLQRPRPDYKDRLNESTPHGIRAVGPRR